MVSKLMAENRFWFVLKYNKNDYIIKYIIKIVGNILC